MWIALIVLAVIILLLIAVGIFFFDLSIIRKKEGATSAAFPEDSIWNPFNDRMQAGLEYVNENTSEKITITSYDGLKLVALHIPCKGECKGTMLLFHGYRSTATVDFIMQTKFFNDLGYRVLLIYQRSHGESEGKYITYGVKESRDCKAWCDYAAERFGGDIFTGGISMGCATVVMALSEKLPENVRGVIADCGFTSPWDIISHVAKMTYKLPSFPLMNILNLLAKCFAGFDLREKDTRKILRSNKTIPVFFIHGAQDDFVPTRMTKENYRACRAEKELFIVEGAEHAQSYGIDPVGYEERTKAFLKRYSTYKK